MLLRLDRNKVQSSIRTHLQPDVNYQIAGKRKCRLQPASRAASTTLLKMMVDPSAPAS
jgi:hypothetical protein